MARSLLPILLATVLMAGCGGGQGEPGDVALHFEQALNDGDIAKACHDVSPGLRGVLDVTGGCAALSDYPSVSLPKLGRVAHQDAQHAQAEITGAGGRSVVVSLTHVHGSWQVYGAKMP
jgi:hypothetical protein